MKMMAIGLGKQKGAEICHLEEILHIGIDLDMDNIKKIQKKQED